MNPENEQSAVRRLVLCFDGTANKFTGDETDTNIVKIYQMLDRRTSDQFHYYQRLFIQIFTFISSNYRTLSDINQQPESVAMSKARCQTRQVATFLHRSKIIF
jgi:uncharacterized protein (DUF2235 family)